MAGISYARHPQLGRPAIFLYDGHPGGAGLAPGLFDRVESLLEATRELVADCECEEGCPSCVHSPKCGSGNRPIDKTAARQVLELLQGGKGLGPLIPQALASSGVQVVIGGEHSRDEMREYSVVLSRYGVAGEVEGVLGVIGPTRMPYPRTISTVRYISSVMSDLLGELYGGEGIRYPDRIA